MAFVFSNAWLDKCIDKLTQAAPGVSEAGPLNGAIVKLFSAAVNITPATVIGDLTIADYDGYADSTAVAWNPGGISDQEQAYVLGDMKFFAYVDGATHVQNQIYGYCLVDASGEYIGAETFPAAQPMGQNGDQMAVVPSLTPLNDANAGGVLVA